MGLKQPSAQPQLTTASMNEDQERVNKNQVKTSVFVTVLKAYGFGRKMLAQTIS